MRQEDLTHKTIRCTMKVHSKANGCFQRIIYQRSNQMVSQSLDYYIPSHKIHKFKKS